jgi:hypothetical protein
MARRSTGYLAALGASDRMPCGGIEMLGTWQVRTVAVVLGVLLVVLGGEPASAEAPTKAPPPVRGGVGADVVGGDPISITEAPWQVSLWIDNDTTAGDDFVYFTCGGSIISSRVIITAAHCLYDDQGHLVTAADVYVESGVTDPFPESVPLRSVARRSRHPRYETTITNDIAYLQLAQPLSLSSVQQPIATAGPGDQALYPDGADAAVSGWGSTDPSPDEESDFPTQLQGATVPIVDDEDCADAYETYGEINDDPNYSFETIDQPTMVCAGSGTVDTCFGDSGGPLSVDDGGTPLLVGLTSFGTEECADDIAPGVYTEVLAYADMTEAHLGPAPFVDVLFGHPFLTEIFHLEDDGILGGFPDGTYRPGNVVSRQAMSAFLYRLAGEPAFVDPAMPTFIDVSASHPFFSEIEWMAAEGISTGFQPGPRYRPSDAVTRQAMSAFMYRFADEPPFTPPGSPTFSDVGPAHPFYEQIEWMADAGISTGFADGTFKPAAAVTRQSMAAFLYRLLPLL